MVEFSTLLRIVVTVTLVSAVLAYSVAGIGTFVHMPYAGQLFGAFLDTFKLGTGALFGLVGGRTVTGKRS